MAWGDFAVNFQALLSMFSSTDQSFITMRFQVLGNNDFEIAVWVGGFELLTNINAKVMQVNRLTVQFCARNSGQAQQVIDQLSHILGCLAGSLQKTIPSAGMWAAKSSIRMRVKPSTARKGARKSCDTE